MNRWCIIATPRSGSTWLELMLSTGVFNTLNDPDKKNFLNLGEYFLPYVYYEEKIDFELDDNHNFCKKKASNITVNDSLFFENRLLLIKNNNISQSVVMRLFPDNITWRSFNYFNFIDTLIEKKFQFIGLYRNHFHRSLSWYLMDNTLLIHKYKNSQGFQFSTKKGLLNNFDEIQKIKIDTIKMKSYITRTLEEAPHFQQLIEYVKCPVIKYETMLDDCKKFNLPINESIDMVKNYDIPYEELIINYQEVKDNYEYYLKNG